MLASFIEQGSQILGDVIRMAVSKSITGNTQQVKPINEHATLGAPTAVPTAVPTANQQEDGKELQYRFECLGKHLGGASVILREAYERANDEGVGEGTAEKIIEVMNEHAGAEADLEKMVDIPEGKPVADRILSGIRAFRKACWEANLPRGQGTKKDIEDARLWNNILLKDALDAAKKYPGTECVRSGM